jgi:peptidoglycan hydrolase CwlO-like protein
MKALRLHFFLIVFAIISVAVFFPQTNKVFSQTATPENTGDNSSELKKEIEKKIAEYEQKLTEVRNQKNTLSAQINYMDTQVAITELRITQTQEKIKQMENEINVLGARISNLNNSLNELSTSLLQRIASGYKNRTVSVFDFFLDSTNASNLVNRLKYFEKARERNQETLLQVQEAKSNFEEQKDLREKRAEKLEELKGSLTRQQNELERQKVEKRVLLAETQNDEQRYSALIEEARRQIGAFKRFVQTTGASIIGADALGTGEGGWYLSQRDERWARNAMGASNESVLDVGCFITSISMVMRKDGISGFTPLNLATNHSYFVPPTAYMYRPTRFNGTWPNGKNYRNITYSQVAEYLNKGVPVISGVQNASHYVVLKKTEGSTFIMNDPIYGPDKKVSEYYALSGPYGVFE